jgi:CheY-like chemotaxis protein
MLRVLVADHCRATQQFFTDLVSTSAVDLVISDSGPESLEMLATGGFDLAFVAADLPDLAGADLIGQARQRGCRSFIASMASASCPTRAELLQRLAVYDELLKPVAADDVATILDNGRKALAPLRTLIVDDSATMRCVIRRVIGGSAFRLDIEEATDGEAALAAHDKQPFDVVILDCNMPGLTGIDTLDRLLARRSDTHVIMISAERDGEAVTNALGRGAVDFLHKPFFAVDIDRVLYAALGLRWSELVVPPADEGAAVLAFDLVAPPHDVAFIDEDVNLAASA